MLKIKKERLSSLFFFIFKPYHLTFNLINARVKILQNKIKNNIDRGN